MAETQPATEALMEAADVEVCRHGDSRAIPIKGLNWRVEAGSYWLVGGPSDSGKTALLQTSAGLQRPARGSVRLFGQEVANLPEPELLKLRTRVGYVFKGGGRLFGDMTVAENIALPLRYHRNLGAEEALETVHALLHLTDLGDIGPENPSQLPGGLRLRVGLSRALALKPEILFLDEPLSGFGPWHRQWWLDFLQQLSDGIPFMDNRKIAVVATTNDFAPWSGRAVSFAVVHDQRWQALGRQKELPNLRPT